MSSSCKMQPKKVLVIQFRTDQSLAHEQDCFYEECEDYSADFRFVNAIEDNLDPDILRNYDGLILGGSGEKYLTKGHGKGDWLDDTYRILESAISEEMHTLGVCFGSQIMTLHQGGELTDDKKHHESGSYEITLEDRATDCEIFSNLDSKFHATLAHQDSPIKVPNHFDVLAKSERCPYQAFRIKGKPAWGVLFHPELNRRRLKYRLNLYPTYIENGDLLKETMRGFEDTSHSGKVLHHFLSEI